MFPNVKDPKEITIEQLLQGLMEFEKTIDKDPGKRHFANLDRNPDGTFNDDSLVEILAGTVTLCLVIYKRS